MWFYIFFICALVFSLRVSSEPYIFYKTPSEDVIIEDAIFNAVIRSLPNYLIKTEEVSLARAIYEIDKGNGTCIRNLVKTPERSSKYLFSKPMTFFFGVQAYVYPKSNIKIDTFKSLGEVLEHNPKWVIGIEKQRSYGEDFDNALKKIKKRNIYIKDGSESETQMYDMFRARRFDILLEYPSVVRFLNRNKNIPKEHEPLPLLKSEYLGIITGHLACIDSVHSQNFLKDFNEKLNQLFKQGELHKLYRL